MFQHLNSAVGIFNSPYDVECAINELQKTGYDMKKLSVVGGLFMGWLVSLLALEGPLAIIGLPYASIHQYEKALKANKFILIVQGSLQEVEQATRILIDNRAEYANYHKDLINMPPHRV